MQVRILPPQPISQVPLVQGYFWIESPQGLGGFDTAAP